MNTYIIELDCTEQVDKEDLIQSINDFLRVRCQGFIFASEKPREKKVQSMQVTVTHMSV